MNKTCLFIYFIMLAFCCVHSHVTAQEKRDNSENNEFQFECTSYTTDSILGWHTWTRQILKRPNFASFASDDLFKVDYNICINREGELTYIKLASAHGIKDKGTIRELMSKLYELKFLPDSTAPRKVCGTCTLKILGVKYNLR